MERRIIRKVDGITTIEPYEREKTLNQNNDPHLCMNCVNGCVSRCKKIADIKKRNIEDYDFITKGFQVVSHGVNKDKKVVNSVDKFVVENCTNFVMDPPDESKKKEKDATKKKAALMMHYFGTESIEESYRIMIQDNLRNIRFQRQKNIANGRPETEDVGRYIPSGLKKDFEYEFGIVSTSKNGPKKR